jgi:hypothetical protein
MSDKTRVEQLLEEIFDSDRTPEEICADCPELLAEVRKRPQSKPPERSVAWTSVQTCSASGQFSQ